jgi:hypothetical protein
VHIHQKDIEKGFGQWVRQMKQSCLSHCLQGPTSSGPEELWVCTGLGQGWVCALQKFCEARQKALSKAELGERYM